MTDEIQPYNAPVMAGRPAKTEAPRFGQRLAALRQKKGLTQAQLADRLNTTQKTIDYYERRALNPSLDVIERVAEALNVSVAELLGDHAKPRRSRPGPAPKLQRRFEQISQLPRREQDLVIRLLDTILEKANLESQARSGR